MMVSPMIGADDGGGPGAMDPELAELRRRRLQELTSRMASKRSEGSEWPNEPFEVTDANIEEMAAKYPQLIVDCWAEWCGPCRMLGPTIHELAGDLHGRVAFGKLNTDSNPKTPRKYGIMSIPTLLFYKDGQVVGKTIGALPKEHILEAIEKTYGKIV
jgi:thioredoxin 1